MPADTVKGNELLIDFFISAGCLCVPCGVSGWSLLSLSASTDVLVVGRGQVLGVSLDLM